MTTDRRGLDSYEKRKSDANCEKGKHLWLVNKIEPQKRDTSEYVLFKLYGRCGICSAPGESDLLTKEELPVNEKLFEMLHASRLKSAMSVKTAE